jgi:hypothetical protein
MQNKFRTFLVHGKPFSACGQVIVNDVVIHSGPFVDPILYSFVTDVAVHSSMDTKIILDSGSLHIYYVEVRYPALINHAVRGYYTLRMPIEKPMVSQTTNKFLEFPVIIKDQIHYQHLAFNGPSHWSVTVDDTVPLCDGINAHDNFVLNKEAIWDYDYIKFNIKNPKDIRTLIK